MQKSVNFLELIGGGKVPEVIVGTWIVMGILIVFGFAARRSLARAKDPIVPDDGLSLRAMSEVLVEWLDGFVHEVLEVHGYRALVPFFGCIFMFILFANFFGLIPGMEPPTGDSDLTFALGTICFVYYIVQGFKSQGAWYLKSFLGPYLPLAFLMLPIELADNLFRPFSLGIRLYANMFADHTVLSIFTGLTKLVIPLAFYALGSIVCVIQAIIFVVLSMSYVRLAASHEH
ncbi:MAG TPA: F0F1 ATP synthase subunit A [Candidatus Binataceae bacterium]|nr:F0F1 ATP synthase subunit A [Candidatus Binataceae bacterium]